MPVAFRNTDTDTLPTKDIFANAHLKDQTPADFPVLLSTDMIARVMLKVPHDYTSTTLLQLWLWGYVTEANAPFTVIVRAATCEEDKDTHTETHAITKSLTADYYGCVDLTTTFATVIAAFSACDMLMIDIQYTGTEDGQKVIGVRLRYS